MHLLDFLFIIATAFFVFVGIRRGLIGELFRLLALVAGFFVAFLYYQEMAKLFSIRPAYVKNAMSFTLIFLIVVCAVIGTGWLLKKIIHLTPLGWADSFFGGAIGGAKAVLVFWVICLSCASFPPTKYVLNLQRSIVFKTYKKLPPGMKLAGITKMRTLFKKKNDQNGMQKQKHERTSDTSITSDTQHR